MSSSLATVERTPPRALRWPRPLAFDASVGLHLCAGAAAWALPGAELWALGTVAFNHAVLTAAGLLPRSALLGPNLRRLPEAGWTGGGAGASAPAPPGRVALTFDDGPDPEVTPQVLDQLDAAGARATFFCIADRARRHAALTREIVARGHNVQNHSSSHRHHFSLLGPRGFEREIGRAQALVADLTGVAPHCFRAPAGLRNPLLDPVLHRLDLHLVSWTRRGFDTADGHAPRVLARLLRDLASRDILLLHDGHARRGASGRPVVLEVLPALLERLRAAGLATTTLSEAVPRRAAGSVA
ncbi:MAG: polysaccharide deacetylase family protein [Burkholderiales bacterium]|nr:polysaccharide deacetylase family protein [Burkholderiales bacterium]